MTKRPHVDVCAPYAAALAQAKRPGAYCAMNALASFVHPGLHMDGVEEELAWPLPLGQARDIIGHLAGRTSPQVQVVDDSCCVDASSLVFDNPAWNTLVSSLASGDVRRELGLQEYEVQAALSHLVIDSSTGAAITPPQPPADSFGTLLIAMPSYHEGGRLVVRLARAKKIFDTSGRSVSNMALPHYCAYYHTKGSVIKNTRPSSGRRVWLVYHLTLHPRAPAEPSSPGEPAADVAVLPPPPPPSVAAAVASLRTIALTRHIRPQPYVHFLNTDGADAAVFSYKQLSWDSLSGENLAQAQALVATGFFDVYIAKITRQHKRPHKNRSHRMRHRHSMIHYLADLEDEFMYGSDYSDEMDEMLNYYDDEYGDDDHGVPAWHSADGAKTLKEKYLVGRLIVSPKSDAPAALAAQAPVVTREDFLTPFPSAVATSGPHVALIFYPKTLRLQFLGLTKGVDALTIALADQPGQPPSRRPKDAATRRTSPLYKTPEKVVEDPLLGYPSTLYMARRLMGMFRQHADRQRAKVKALGPTWRWHQDSHNEAAKVALLPMFYALVQVGDPALLGEFLDDFFPTFLANLTKYDGVNDELFDTLAGTIATFGVDVMYLPFRYLCQNSCRLDPVRGSSNCLEMLANMCGTPSRGNPEDAVVHGTQALHRLPRPTDPTPPESLAALWSTPYACELVRGCFSDIVGHRFRPPPFDETVGGPHGEACRCPAHSSPIDVGFLVQALQIDHAIQARLARHPQSMFLHALLPLPLLQLVDSFELPSLVALLTDYFRERQALIVTTLAPALNHFVASLPSLAAAKRSLRRLQPLVDAVLAYPLPDTLSLVNDYETESLRRIDGLRLVPLACLIAVAATFPHDATTLKSVLGKLKATIQPPMALVTIMGLALRTFSHIAPLIPADTTEIMVQTALTTAGNVTSLEMADLHSFVTTSSYAQQRGLGTGTNLWRAVVVTTLFAIARAFDHSSNSNDAAAPTSSNSQSNATSNELGWSGVMASHLASFVTAESTPKDAIANVFVAALLNDGATYAHQFAAWKVVANACIDRLVRDLVHVPAVNDWSMPQINVASHTSDMGLLASYFFRSPREYRVELQGREVAWVGDLSRLLHQLAAQDDFKHLFQVRQLSSRTARVKGRLEIVKLGTRASVEDIERAEILRADRAAQDALVTKLTDLIARADTAVPPKCSCVACSPPPSAPPTLRRVHEWVTFIRG